MTIKALTSTSRAANRSPPPPAWKYRLDTRLPRHVDDPVLDTQLNRNTLADNNFD